MRSSALALGLGLVAVVSSFSGCQKAGEAALGAATGGAVKLNGGQLDIKGADGSTAHIDTNAGKVDIKGVDGSVATMGTNKDGIATLNATGADGKLTTATFGGGALPEKFPLALPSGFKVVSSTAQQTGKGTSLAVMATGTGFDAAAAQVEADSKKLGLSLAKNEMKMEGMHSLTFSGNQGDKSAAISVNEGADHGVTLTYQLTGF